MGEIDARLCFIYFDSKNARKLEWVESAIDYIKETNTIANLYGYKMSLE